MTTQPDITPHGINEIGTPEYSGRCWVRFDVYTSNSTREQFEERRFCNGPSDHSPMFRAMYAGQGNGSYDPRCSCCYLGFSHTVDYHNHNIQTHRSRGCTCQDCQTWDGKKAS